MRTALLLVFVTAFIGCEAKSKFETKQFTEEEKQKIRSEDKAVQDEESYGTAGKVKPKKK